MQHDLQQPRYRSNLSAHWMDEWIKKMWYLHTMEYYSVIKKSKALPTATTCMDLEGIMLSEISQTKNDKYCMISLIHGI